ncbi:oxidoreductase [Qipengyuania qiaonensis]|uniref:SDR family NAD(P)-dependent oxidoreductase n=1 Tax=Qipengyuania qiaonensis TaxID=2867240 RepID=A0ABS7JD74_9SPHN|nr:oxidoreductase [Qipengyuania qiaonensis]MBX7483900.1 SDR family NAD(P)-dependent oxidoreductase [Qipengyuania qiaonensis]
MDDKVWFITGATRGLGLEIARAALGAGNRVIATGRDATQAKSKLPESDALLFLDLDVTNYHHCGAAITRARDHFGRIDVLVNNAGYGQMGIFETVSDRQIRKQFDVNVFGVMEMTRRVLPIMRQQRSGHIISITSIGGTVSFPASAVYCASKHAVEGFSEGVAQEVAEFGIDVTIVEPGFFRTDFLDESSASYGELEISEIAQAVQQQRETYTAMNHRQSGDPRKLGEALVAIAKMEKPPMRLLVGTDALNYVGNAYAKRLSDLATHAKLSASTDFEDQ